MDFKAGDVVKIHLRIKEGEKQRLQMFEGLVLGVKGRQSSSPTITVRKVSHGVGVEMIVPLLSKNVEKIELVKKAKVRRAKLYYIRDLTPKQSRMKYKVLKEAIGEKVEAKLTDLYTVGAKTWLIASLTLTGDQIGVSLAGTNRLIEGSEINVSFDKSDIDEAKPNAEGVLIGTLKLTAASDYNINRLVVKAESASGTTKIVKDMELDGKGFDVVSTTSTGITDNTNSGSTVVYYAFEDIALTAGETKELDLVYDIEEASSLNGSNVKFTVSIVKVEDEENDEIYDSVPELATVLSTNSLDPKVIDVKTARLTLTQTKVSERTLVIGNGVEVVLYKGKLSVGDSDDVTIEDLTLTGSIYLSGTTTAVTYNYDDILDNVTLNIGGKTFDADINDTNVEFNSINAVVAAGSDNVEVTVTAVLKDTDDVTAGDELVLDNVAITAEDSENEALVSGNLLVQGAADTTIVLNEEGSLDFKVVQNGDNKDEIDDVVLAGTNGVALAEIEFEANEENIKVEELVFTASGDVSTTLENVRLVNGSNVIVDGAVVTLSGSNTVITFKNDFTVDTATNKVKALLVADLNSITTEGGQVSADAGNIYIDLTSVESKWVNSNEDIIANTTSTAQSLAVSVVPALVTVSIVDEMGSNDSDAIIRFTIDKGNNDLDNSDILVKSIALETAVAGSGVTVRNDDNTTLVANSNASTIDLSAVNADLRKIVNGDEFELKVSDDNSEVRVKAKGIVVTIDGADYTISNDKVIDLGEYDAN